MNYDELVEFIEEKMSMTYSYQPVIIKKLLESNNIATKEDIAKVLVNNDHTLIDHYKKILMRWPKQTLEKHNIVKYKKNIKSFVLLIDNITTEQKNKLIKICEDKYNNHKNIAEGAKVIREAISGPLRYKVLKKSYNVCALCNKKKELEIDHIQPVSLGGNNDLKNLQALCRTCNAQKNNQDNTDFTKVYKKLNRFEQGCSFCKPKKIIKTQGLAIAIPSQTPLSTHIQITTKRHTNSFDDLILAEQHSCMELIKSIKLYYQINNIKNIHINFNSIETLGHFHINVIPLLYTMGNTYLPYC